MATSMLVHRTGFLCSTEAPDYTPVTVWPAAGSDATMVRQIPRHASSSEDPGRLRLRHQHVRDLGREDSHIMGTA